MRCAFILAAILSAAGAVTATAQVTFIRPDGAGGYTTITPGRAPTFIRPNGAGGYTEFTPGRPPTFINPNVGGGYTAITPGLQPPSAFGPSYGYRRY